VRDADWQLNNKILEEIGRGGMGVIYRAATALAPHRCIKSILAYHADSRNVGAFPPPSGAAAHWIIKRSTHFMKWASAKMCCLSSA
jgi:hypothetical protein